MILISWLGCCPAEGLERIRQADASCMNIHDHTAPEMHSHDPDGAHSSAALRVFAARQGMGVLYGRGGSCWSAHVFPSGSLKVTNDPHG